MWGDLVVVYVAGAVVLLAFSILAYRHWSRARALQFTLPSQPMSTGGYQFGAEIDDKAALGKVGELVTALILTKDGWRQLPSQPHGVHGLDGIFVRPLRRPNRFEVRLVETKCSREGLPKANYTADQMSDANVIGQIAKLRSELFEAEPYITPKVADEISSAIKRRSRRLTKWLYAHTFSTGTTLVYPIARDGSLIDLPPRRVRRVSDDSHRYMLQALAIGLSRLSKTNRFEVRIPSVAMSNEPSTGDQDIGSECR